MSEQTIQLARGDGYIYTFASQKKFETNEYLLISDYFTENKK